MCLSLKEKIILLADKYETPEFLQKDPSQFMHKFLPQNGGSVRDAELVAFLSANLAFGRRDQILSHIQIILDKIKESKKSPAQWVLDGEYEKTFDESKKSFYRMYTFLDMKNFFRNLQIFLSQKETLGDFFKEKWENSIKNIQNKEEIFLHSVIAESFCGECALICRSKNGAAKKLNMFLRWMVRENSPVDLGLWKWYDKNRLLIPLDTHVMQEAVKFSLIEKTSSGKIPSANLKTAVALSKKMSEYFPGDPARGDFALFGLGVDN